MSYEKISSTAETIAFVRAGTSIIPWAEAIAEESGAEEATKQFYHRDNFDVDLERMKKMRSWVVLRHFALFGALMKSGFHNVLELASGLSPAGIASVTHTWGYTFKWVETDLRDMLRKKESIFTTSLQLPMHRLVEQLLFEELDVFDGERMRSIADKHFPTASLAVVHEGLLQYLDHGEKSKLASNIRKVLERHGGAWITTDIVLQEHLEAAFNQSPYMQRVHQILTENTGRDMAKLAFTSFHEAADFFNDAGFVVEKACQMDFSTAKNFSLGAPRLNTLELRKNLKHQQIWTMRLKK